MPAPNADDDRRLIAASGVFDVSWYLSQIPPDDRPEDPLGHFLGEGWRQGLDPGPRFNIAFYRSQDPVPGQLLGNPLLHYLRGGWRFGLRPAPGFEAHPVARRHPEVCPLVLELALASRSGRGSDGVVDGSRTWPAVSDPTGVPAYEPPAQPDVTAVAFYLPQFHPIPENDDWWGEGFTEWTNVRRGQPRFEGHYQPHVPGDLGYYDLIEEPEIMRRQVDLAKRHGVGAFCFYTYWFGGRRLLESPLDRWLNDPSLDLPYCVCWANENWTRTWDGKSSKVLIGQKHSAEDDLAFIAATAAHLRDPRYLRVGGRPLLLLYRPGELPDPRATARRWREWCRANGVGEICLAYVQSFDTVEPAEFGFDFAIEFPPNNMSPLQARLPVPAPEFDGTALDWRSLAARPFRPVSYPIWRGVTPSWDNEARRPGRGTLLWGSDPDLFGKWVERAVRDARDRFEKRDERLIWVNAWNEWAEGAHLEPDQRYGYRWLHAVRDGQEAGSGIVGGTGPGVVVIAHDLQRNGAQFGSLALARELSALGRRVEIVACGGGPLESDARRITATTVVDDRDSSAMSELAADLVRRGFTSALANSSVSGFFANAMHRAGAHVVGLVHELPGVLADPERADRAAALAASADELVFPDRSVLEQFPPGIRDEVVAQVRPQGRYQPRGPGADAESRERLRRVLQIPPESRVVLGVGYADHRKGPDLLARAVRLIPEDRDGAPVHLVWIGEIDTADQRIAEALAGTPPDRMHMLGFQPDPGDYYRGADVLALPSREDPYPSVTIEALDAGLPVVAFRDATGQNTMIEETAGILVSKRTPEALAEGLLQALGEDTPGAAGERRSYIAERFNYRQYVLDLLSLTPAAIPRVSVVIPNYNYGHLIRGRIDQILSQSHPVYEVIVLDDASTDDSLERIRSVLDASGAAIRLLVNEENSGSVYRQWARGVAECSGDLVWIAEADDVADPGFLAEVASPMRDPDVVLSYCESRQIDNDGKELAPDYRAWTDLGTRDYTRRYLRAGTAEIRDCLAIKNTLPNASAVVMRLDPLRQLLLARGEEVASQHPTTGDWWIYLQLLRDGWISYSPRALNAHRRHSASVIGAGDHEAHLSEIRAVHDFVADTFPITVQIQAKQEQLLRQLARA